MGSQGLDAVFTSATPFPSTNAYIPLQTYQASCLSATTLSPYTYKGAYWFNQKCGQGGGYSHIMLPNQRACMFSTDPDMEPGETMVGASSFHSGGVNVAMLDGSVKFIKSSVALQTWSALATMAGGEVIDAGSY